MGNGSARYFSSIVREEDGEWTEERWRGEPGCEPNGAGDHAGHDERSGSGMSRGPRSESGVGAWDARPAEHSRRASGLLERLWIGVREAGPPIHVQEARRWRSKAGATRACAHL